MQVRLRFGDLALHFWRKSCTKRSFWRLGASLLEEVSYEALVLETWRFSFGGSLVRSARFGDLALVLESWRFSRFGVLALHFWRKSRTKRWSWRLGASVLEEVSYEALVLETWRFTFGGSLVRSARFGDLALHFWRKSCTKALVLETQKWRFTFGGSLVRSAGLGDLALQFWRKSRTKRSFWRLGASLLEEVSYEALVLESWRFSRFGVLALHFWRKSRTKRWFWRLGASLVELDSELASL